MRKFICLVLLIIVSFVPLIQAQNADPIRVGVFLDMTGETSSFGISTFSGIKMAFDEINARGGVNGRQLEIFLEDDQGRPEMAQAAAGKLIAESRVHALLGEVLSTNSLAAAPVAQAGGVPMITPSSTNEKITKVGDYIFRTCFIDSFQGEAMARFAFQNLKLRRIALLTDFNSDYAKGLSEKFAATFTLLGGKIVVQKTFFQGDEDYFQQLDAVQQSRPDGVYIAGYYNSVGVIARQARSMKINSVFLGGDGWDSPDIWKLGSGSLNNSYITNHFAANDPAENVKKFTASYKSLFGLEPDAFAALAYDAANLLADAVKRAGSTDGRKIRDAIAATKDFPGVTGKITINDSRNAKKPAVILKLQNPNFVYHSTVQP